MRSIPAQLLADLKADTTSIAFLWTITLNDGRMIRGTEHDQDITIPPSASPDPFAGTYYAIANITLGDIVNNTDMSVGNLEVTGALAVSEHESSGQATVLDVSIADVEAGLYDLAKVSVLICNWQHPDHGFVEVKTGTLGAINTDSDGKYITEVRGLTQLLAQTVIRTFATSCNVVKFGDIRCGFDVAAHTITGTVSTDTSGNREQFGVDLAAGSPPSGYGYDGGTLTFTSGANSGFSREVKQDPNFNSGIVIFWEQFPENVNPGDAFTLAPGCDRQAATCKMYGRFAPAGATGDRGGWKGYGYFVPGVNSLTSGPNIGQTGIL